MLDEESDYEYVSNSIRFDSRVDGPDFKELIRAALQRYEDVAQEEFTLVADHPDGSYSLSDTSLHYNRHTLVPIGANFQVVIPPMMTEGAYRAKSGDMMRILRILKINDPDQGGRFYDQHIDLVNRLLGPDRTYEDVNILHNAFKKLNSQLPFEEYLTKNQLHWESQFRKKDRASAPRQLQKKKKKKGTIPI